MSIYDKASLVLIPSGTKTSKVYSQVPTNGDGDFTFSRSTAATRVNASGNIEKETGNLLLQSNTLDTTWYNSGTTETGGQAGYDGTNDAWEITKQTAGAYRYIAQAVTSSGVQTASFYAKAGSLSRIGILVGGGDNPYVSYDLSTGTILAQRASVIDSTMTDVGGGWYRCTMTYNVAISDINIYPDWDLANTGNLYLQDIQLEQGLVARDYIETTTTAIYGGITDNVPRLDYQGSCPALLLEPQRTNLATQSEYFTDIFTENSGVTWESNSTTSPEGLVNAFKLNNSNASSSGAYYVPLAFTDNDTMTASIFAKEGDVSELLFGITNQNESKSLYYSFDLSAGTATYNANNGGILNGSGSIVDYGNGWYRCIVTGTFPSSGTTSGGVFPRIPQAGYVYLYGLQVEKNGSYPTSYIPTYGSAVTRNKELNYITSSSSLIGQTEGVVYMDFIAQTSVGLSQSHFWLGASGNEIGLYGGTSFIFYSSGGVSINGGGFTNGQRYKVAFAYKANDYVAYVNGVQVGTDTSASVPTMSTFYINSYFNGTEVRKKNINQTLLFPTRLSNEELATLTTI